MNKRGEESKYFFKNKKADIAVTILVLGVLALLIFGLLSFYLVGEKIRGGEIVSFSYLQEIYNDAESVRFSEGRLAPKYGAEGGGKTFFIQRSVSGDIGSVLGIGGESREILKIKYTFDK